MYHISGTYYMVTIHAHSKFRKVTRDELNSAVNFLKKQYHSIKIINVGYEYRHNFQLHVHLVVRTDHTIRYIGRYRLLQIHWYKINDQTDLHKKQIYVSKEQYDYSTAGAHGVPIPDCLKTIKKREFERFSTRGARV